jgi:PKD repeat protein
MRRVRLTAALAILPLAAILAVTVRAQGLNTSPPTSTVKLIFIHHSTGEAWLGDTHGQLGLTLRDNHYFVSDTNYGWGPSGIGNSTDIGNWYDWFSGPNRDTYMAALYAEYGQHCSYSRLATDPGGANQIVMFKSCFPNSNLMGSPADAVPPIASNPLRSQSCGSSYHTVGNAKGIYIELLNYFAVHPEKLFVVITAPPLRSGDTNSTYAANARYFNTWLSNEWLAGYAYHNVVVFDFYNVLTSNGGSTRINDPNTNDLGWADGNHHRVQDDAVVHMRTVAHNYLAYWTGDSHPSAAGDRKASGEFVALLNAAYHCWKGTGGCPGCFVSCTASAPTSVQAGTSVSFAGSGSSSGCATSPAYDWNFGDGTAHGTTASVTHTYGTAGTYAWTFTVTAGSQACARTGSVRAYSPAPLRVPGSVQPTKLTSSNGGSNGTVTWDASVCPSAGYHLIYGFGTSLSSWAVSGGACNLGSAGSYAWSGIPAPTPAQRFLWFLVVGDNGPGSNTEGSWGLTSSGAERGGTAASGLSCTVPFSIKSTSGSCVTP